jgi:hypothetical protein
VSRLALVLLVLAVAACSRVETRLETPPPLVNVCSDMCKTPCPTTATPERMPKWQCADPDAGECWDLGEEQTTNPLITALEQCEIKRADCLKCIERADNANATCGTVKPCGQE